MGSGLGTFTRCRGRPGLLRSPLSGPPSGKWPQLRCQSRWAKSTVKHEDPRSEPGPFTVLLLAGCYSGCDRSLLFRVGGPDCESGLGWTGVDRSLADRYSTPSRRSLDLVSGELRVRHGNGKKPRQVTLPLWAVPALAVPALKDWLQVRGSGHAGPAIQPGSAERQGCQARGGELEMSR
jgi:hypothetical protein